MMWHVSSSLNRASIRAHGLDPARMGAARGIAGSTRPEVDGVFLCTEDHLVDFFVRMNNTGGPVDVWCVDGVGVDDLVESSSGFEYLPGTIPPGRATLARADAVVDEAPYNTRPDTADGHAYRSSLTITIDDGTVLTGDEAHAWTDQRQAEG